MASEFEESSTEQSKAEFSGAPSLLPLEVEITHQNMKEKISTDEFLRRFGISSADINLKSQTPEELQADLDAAKAEKQHQQELEKASLKHKQRIELFGYGIATLILVPFVLFNIFILSNASATEEDKQRADKVLTILISGTVGFLFGNKINA